MSNQCPDNRVKWIYNTFGECVTNTRQQFGFWIGLSSTVIWMYAQIPQIIMNFKSKNVEALSFPFLCLLVTGDICNLVGAIITHGLVTQIITATWFVAVDVFCLLQYIVFHWIIPSIHKRKQSFSYSSSNYEDDAVFSPTPLLIAAAVASSPTNPYKPPALYGTLLGWASAISYISSRTPQIVKNCKRKHTDGLSIQFFISAVLGNTTYGVSIFLKDYHWPYIWQQFPWLAGSLGILFFDFTVLGQFLAYDRKHKKEEFYEEPLNE